MHAKVVTVNSLTFSPTTPGCPIIPGRPVGPCTAQTGSKYILVYIEVRTCTQINKPALTLLDLPVPRLVLEDQWDLVDQEDPKSTCVMWEILSQFIAVNKGNI